MDQPAHILSDILQFIFMGLQRGSIYALAAMGFNMIYNATGIINFAQGEFVVLGGLMMVTLSTALSLSIPVAFVLTTLFVTVVGICMERFTINPVKHPTVLRLIIITIAVSIIIKGAAMCLWGKNSHFMRHFSSSETWDIYGATILRLAGINDRKMVMLSFALSAGIGAIAGIIITPIIQMDYTRGALLGIKGFGAAVLGGLGNSMGAVIAGILIGILEAMAAGYVSSHYMDAIALIILLAVLFVKPSGIFGSAEAMRLKEF